MNSAVKDIEVVHRVLSGNRDAFRLIVERYQHQVLTLCRRVLGHAQDAEDCAQTAFVKAYTALGSYKTAAPFKNWLYRIAVNECIELQRRHRRAPSMYLDDEDCPPLSSDEPLPDESAEAAERHGAVVSALNRLEEKYRLPMVLFYMEGCDYNEISSILRLRLGTVKTRLRRGRLLLRSIVAAHSPELIREEA